MLKRFFEDEEIPDIDSDKPDDVVWFTMIALFIL